MTNPLRESSVTRPRYIGVPVLAWAIQLFRCWTDGLITICPEYNTSRNRCQYHLSNF